MNGLEGGRGSCFPSLEARFVKGEFFLLHCDTIAAYLYPLCSTDVCFSFCPFNLQFKNWLLCVCESLEVCGSVCVGKCVEVRAGMWACVVGGGG